MAKAKSWYKERIRRDGEIRPEPFVVERTIPSRQWRKKYECKKNKGDHSFIPLTIHNQFCYEIQTMYGIAYTTRLRDLHPGEAILHKNLTSQIKWECTACKKPYTEYIGGVFGSTTPIPDKKMDKYRSNIFQ